MKLDEVSIYRGTRTITHRPARILPYLDLIQPRIADPDKSKGIFSMPTINRGVGVDLTLHNIERRRMRRSGQCTNSTARSY